MSNQEQSPGDELIDLLDDLRVNLNQLVQKCNDSGIERTKGLRDVMGEDCVYYKKSLALFIQKDYDELKNLVEACNKKFNQIEGYRGE
jgi:hypothetical protein